MIKVRRDMQRAVPWSWQNAHAAGPPFWSTMSHFTAFFVRALVVSLGWGRSAAEAEQQPRYQ